MFFCPIKNRGIESRLKRPAIDLVWFFLSDFCFIRALIHKIVDERVFSSVSLLYRLIQSRWENPPALRRKERIRVQLLCADVSPVLEKLYQNTIFPESCIFLRNRIRNGESAIRKQRKSGRTQSALPQE